MMIRWGFLFGFIGLLGLGLVAAGGCEDADDDDGSFAGNVSVQGTLNTFVYFGAAVLG